jgi:protein-S-isoprenylcysteine O-methyltransferase Ste14
MLQLAMAYLPVALTATGGGSDRSLQSARAAAPRPSWLGLAAVNLGMLALWLQVAPLAGATREALATAGYGLVALGWAVFVWQLWRTLSGPSRPAAGAPAADERPEEGPATDPQI